VRKQLVVRVFIGAAATCAVLAVLTVVASTCQVETFWKLMSIPLNSLETTFDPNGFNDPDFVLQAARFMAGELRLALCFLGGLTALLGLLCWRPQWQRRLVAAIVGLLALELLQFAWSEHVSFPTDSIRKPKLQQYLQEDLGDGRIFSFYYSNLALTMDGVCDMWGYGSDAVNRRYAEFLAFTQGDDPDQVTGYQTFTKFHPRFDLLRCKYVVKSEAGTLKAEEKPGGLPRFLFVTDWRVVAKRDEVFAEISRPEFNPRKTVLLERQPAGWSMPPAAGEIPTEKFGDGRILRETTDWQELEVTLTRPAILVQTDLYTPNWHVRALPGSVQDKYELIPADYILRSVPLQAGTHRLRIEYLPAKFVVGKRVSLASLVLFAALLVFWSVRVRRRQKAGSELPTPAGCLAGTEMPGEIQEARKEASAPDSPVSG
jgi:hypothetical protein